MKSRAYLTDHNDSRIIFFRYNSKSATAVEIATGFFLSDFVVISLLFFHYGAKQYVQFAAHHVVAVVAFGMVLYYRRKLELKNLLFFEI